ASLGSQYKFDAAKARQLLAEAGYPDPTKLPPIRFQYAGATNKTIAEFLQGQMKSNLGIDITLEALDGRAFGQLMGSRKFSWAAFLWNADYPDPDNWLPDLFGTGAGNNLGGYSNAAFDSLAKQARSELDNPKRLQLLAQAHKIVVDDAPVAFMYYRERIVLVKPSVKGLTTTGMDAGIAGDQFFDLVSISK
ncbi:MAG: peptide ABC transporter substrate-binding protein, partial [Chloroflexi bacterium]|nr:peptide ABC transporter substrate-binding protein [Chloroflexota bacterium]